MIALVNACSFGLVVIFSSGTERKVVGTICVMFRDMQLACSGKCSRNILLPGGQR